MPYDSASARAAALRAANRIRRYRSKRRQSAARTLQSAWRARKRRQRGSLLARTALANRKAIKRIKSDVELKFVNNCIATSRTNYIGQILQNTPVDNYGMSQSTGDWVNAGGGATALAAAKYCPLIMNPICVGQGGTNVVTPPVPGTAIYPAGENTRVGNDIVMSHITFKITLVGSVAQTNGGNYANIVQKQKVTAVLLLDREPAKQAASLTSAAPTFSLDNISCQLYPQTPDGVLALPTLSGESKEFIRSLPEKQANPPGLATGNIGNRNLEALSFYSKDNVMGKSGRFKVLKKMSLSCYQRAGGASFQNFNGSSVPTTASATMTQKGNYKFHFAGNSFIIPDNQTLLLALYSETPTIRSAGGAVPVNYVTPPTVTVLTRFSFRDS